MSNSNNSRHSIKVLLVGPSKVRFLLIYSFLFIRIISFFQFQSGKTTLANFLADAKDATTSNIYRQTVGCRILEFQVTGSNNRNPHEIQLWDCGGAGEHQNSWLPALSADAKAVLLVYDVTDEDQVSQLEEMYQIWNNNYLRLNPSRYLIVGRKWADGQANKKRTIKMGENLI